MLTLSSRTGAAAAIACSLLAIRDARAQTPTASLALTGGVATDQRGVQSNAVTAAPELRFEGAHSVVTLGGSATRFATDVWSLGGGGALARREPIGRFAALTLNASASLSRLVGGATGTYAEAAAIPALEVTLRRLTLFGGGRVAHGSAPAPSAAPQFPFPGSGSSSVVNRSGGGPLYGAVFDLSDGAQSVRIGAREDHLSVEGATFADRSVSLAFGAGALHATLSAGQRASSAEDETFASGYLSIALGASDAALVIGGGSYPGNPLMATPAGKYFNAGIALRFGAPREPSLPAPGGARAPPAGMTRLSIRAPRATRVEVAGDFNEWTLVRATRADNGVWYADLAIPPGQYRYAFKVDGREWRVPDGATAVDDGFGGTSAWLTVRDRSRR
jgi:hypothetical protein